MRSRLPALLLSILFAIFLLALTAALSAGASRERAPSGAGLALLAGTVAPQEIIQSEPVSFRTRVRNEGDLAVSLATASAFEFTDAAGLRYSARLSDTTTIAPGAEADLQFVLAAVPADAQPGAYPFTLDLIGTEDGGAAFEATLPSADLLTVRPNRVDLARVPGSMMPTRPDRYTELVYWMDFDNTGPCAITLDPAASRLILSGPTVNRRDEPLYETVTVAPGGRARIYSAKFLQYGIPDGLYTPGFKLIGANACDGSPFSAFIPADAQSDFGWGGSDEAIGVGCTGGSYFTFNQFGGETQELGFSMHVHGDRQHLLEQELECRWDGCQPLLDAGLIRMAKGRFGYYNSAVNPYYWSPLQFRSTEGIPRGADNLLIVRHYILGAQYCQGCVGIKMGCRWDTHAEVVDREVAAEIAGVEVDDTFLPAGGSVTVTVGVRNPEQLSANQYDEFFYGTTGVYTVEPASRLDVAGAAETSGFASVLVDTGHTIPFSLTHPLRFELVAESGALPGRIAVGATVSATGQYKGWGGLHALTGITSTAGLSITAPVHVVDRLPLEIAAGSLTPRVMRPFGPPPALTMTLRNASDWTFTLAPTATLTLPVQPAHPLFLQLGALTYDSLAQGSTVTAVAQSFRPAHDFLLDKISFDFCTGGGAPAPARIRLAQSRPERTGIGATIAAFDLPAYVPGATMTFDTPPFNVWLKRGETYQVVIESPGEGLCVPYDPIERYPDGGFMLLMPNGWNPYSQGDLPLRFYARDARYEATAVSRSATVLAPGATVELTFPAAEWTKAIATGQYIPRVRVSGDYDDGSGPAAFRQTVSAGDAVAALESGPVSIERAEGGVALRWVEPGAPSYYYNVWRSAQPYFTYGDPGALEISGTQWAALYPGTVAQFVDAYPPVLWADSASFYLVRVVNTDYNYTPISEGAVGVVNFGLAR